MVEFALLKVLNTVTFLVLVATNLISATVFTTTQKEISDETPTILTPVGWCFGIWGMIYTWMTLFVAYQLVYPRDANTELIFGEIGNLFWITNVLNSVWVLVFTANTTTTWVICAVIYTILSGVLTVLMLRVSRAKLKNLFEEVIILPLFGIYAGWTTSATAINILGSVTQIAVASDPDEIPWSNSVDAALPLLIGLLVYYTGFSFYAPNNGYFQLVFSWFCLGIFYRQNGLGTSDHKLVALEAGVMSGCNFLIVAFLFFKRYDLTGCYAKYEENNEFGELVGTEWVETHAKGPEMTHYLTVTSLKV